MNVYDIQDNTIIVCENSYKTYLLKEMSKNHIFLNVKFYSKKEFLNEYLFSYDEKAIYYLFNKYKYKVEIAKMYLENLYFIKDNKEYKSSKLNYLVKLKEELVKEKLLKFNNNFKNYIKDYQIIIVGYPYLDNFEKEIFDNLNAIVVNEIPKYELKNVFEFSHIEDEINFVMKKISELITNGVDINQIKIMGVDEDYYNDLNRISNFYNIPIISHPKIHYMEILLQKNF